MRKPARRYRRVIEAGRKTCHVSVAPDERVKLTRRFVISGCVAITRKWFRREAAGQVRGAVSIRMAPTRQAVPNVVALAGPPLTLIGVRRIPLVQVMTANAIMPGTYHRPDARPQLGTGSAQRGRATYHHILCPTRTGRPNSADISS